MYATWKWAKAWANSWVIGFCFFFQFFVLPSIHHLFQAFIAILFHSYPLYYQISQKKFLKPREFFPFSIFARFKLNMFCSKSHYLHFILIVLLEYFCCRYIVAILLILLLIVLNFCFHTFIIPLLLIFIFILRNEEWDNLSW